MTQRCPVGNKRELQDHVAGMAASAFEAQESLPLVESTRETPIEHGAVQRAARLRDGDG